MNLYLCNFDLCESAMYSPEYSSGISIHRVNKNLVVLSQPENIISNLEKSISDLTGLDFSDTIKETASVIADDTVYYINLKFVTKLN